MATLEEKEQPQRLFLGVQDIEGAGNRIVNTVFLYPPLHLFLTGDKKMFCGEKY